MNRPLVPLLIVLALLWRGLLPAGVMAMPGDNGVEVRLCGLSGGSVVLDLGLTGAPDALSATDHGEAVCVVCAGAASVALPAGCPCTRGWAPAGVTPAVLLHELAPRGPPLRVTARGPPQLI